MSESMRIRSPNYPAFSLKEAIERIGTLYKEVQRNPAPREVIAKGLGYNSLNGASATAISALNKYGLLEGRGDDLRVSDRAMSILHPHTTAERLAAIKAAAVEPRLFAELAERFSGGVPNDELVKNYLLRNGFALSAVTAAVLAYKETSEFVSTESAGYDLVPVSAKGPSMLPQATQPKLGFQGPIHELEHMPQGALATEKSRLLYRYDFADGGFVEIAVSRDVDAELALEIIETALPSMKMNTKLDERKRKTAQHSTMEARRSNDENNNE